jgi:hypothetical protein
MIVKRVQQQCMVTGINKVFATNRQVKYVPTGSYVDLRLK